MQQAIREQLRDRREQLLKAAYYETIRDRRQVDNYFAEEIHEAGRNHEVTAAQLNAEKGSRNRPKPEGRNESPKGETKLAQRVSAGYAASIESESLQGRHSVSVHTFSSC